MNKDKGYVLKNSDGFYFTGHNNADSQLRKARIYHSTKYAIESRDDINSNAHRMPYFKHDFNLIEIEIVEVGGE